MPHDISCRESNIQNSTPSVRPSRKRRLSNSDSHLTAKRPRRSPVGPRAQAVSDPLLAIPDIFPAFSRPEELEASFEMSTCQVTMTPPNSLDSLSLFNNWEALAPAESADFGEHNFT